MEKRKVVDLLVIGLSVLIGAILTLFFGANLTISTLFYYVLPLIYLLFVGKFPKKKIFLTTILWTVLFGILDVVTNLNNGWFVPTEQLLWKLRILGGTPVLEIIWFGILVLFILLFYEHFVETKKTERLSKNFKWAITTIVITAILFVALLLIGFLDQIKYVYLVLWGIYLLPPLIYLLFKKPLFVKKLFFVALPFAIINLVYELTAMYSGQWIFAGEYIGTVILFGLAFSFEEFFFWVIIAAGAMVAYYEIFFDDMK